MRASTTPTISSRCFFAMYPGIADRIAVLDKGEIIAVGSVDEVRSSSNARVQDLLNRRTPEEERDPIAYIESLTRHLA